MKKLTIGLGGILTVLAVAPLFAAFEAHVVNVTATIENALSVPIEELRFGTVFPEEQLSEELGVFLSESFLESDRADNAHYRILQKPKCWNGDERSPIFGRVDEDEEGNFFCKDEGFEELPLLCPFISEEPDGVPEEGNDGGLQSFHGPLGGWTKETSEQFAVPAILSEGNGDTRDLWTIGIDVPCFSGECAQDNRVPPEYQLDPALEHKLFGCDLWIEVTGFSKVLFGDGFESGDFLAGGWVTSENPEITSDSAFVKSGQYAALLRGSADPDPDAAIERSISTAGFGNIILIYHRMTHNTENDDSFESQFSTDGGTSWITLETLHDDTPYGEGPSWYNLSDLSAGAADDNPNLKIRFAMTAGNHTNDKGLVDEVVMIGAPR